MGESYFSAADESQLLKQNNNNTVILRPQWLPLMATMAFFGLLRAIRAATLNHTARRYTYYIHQHTDSHRQPQQQEPRPIGTSALL